MLGFNLAQDPTPVSDAVVVEVVEQATKAIDAFSNLGVFMAVLFVIAVLIVFFGAIVLVLSWSNRKTGQTALDVVSVSNADKIREIQEIREERRQEIAVERLRQQTNHDQFMTALTLLAGKQAEISTGVTSSEQRVTGQVIASGTDVISHVETSKDEVLAALSLLGEFNTEVFKPVSSQPPDLSSMAKILETALKAVKEVQNRQKDDIPPADGTQVGEGDEEGLETAA